MIALTGPMRSRDSTGDSRLAGFGPDSGFGFGFFPEFGFGSVSALRVRIRIGFIARGSDSDRFGLRRFGFGSDRPPQVRIRIGSASQFWIRIGDRGPVWFGFGIRTRGLLLGDPFQELSRSILSSGGIVAYVVLDYVSRAVYIYR